MVYITMVIVRSPKDWVFFLSKWLITGMILQVLGDGPSNLSNERMLGVQLEPVVHVVTQLLFLKRTIWKVNWNSDLEI